MQLWHLFFSNHIFDLFWMTLGVKWVSKRIICPSLLKYFTNTEGENVHTVIICYKKFNTGTHLRQIENFNPQLILGQPGRQMCVKNVKIFPIY